MQYSLYQSSVKIVKILQKLGHNKGPTFILLTSQFVHLAPNSLTIKSSPNTISIPIQKSRDYYKLPFRFFCLVVFWVFLKAWYYLKLRFSSAWTLKADPHKHFQSNDRGHVEAAPTAQSLTPKNQCKPTCAVPHVSLVCFPWLRDPTAIRSQLSWAAKAAPGSPQRTVYSQSRAKRHLPDYSLEPQPFCSTRLPANTKSCNKIFSS